MTEYQITVTAETPRPLLEVPMGVIVAEGEPPRLQLESCCGYAEADVAIEYVARFYGETTMTVVSNGGEMYGVV